MVARDESMVELEDEGADVAVSEGSKEERDIRALVNAFGGFLEGFWGRKIENFQSRLRCWLLVRFRWR